MSASHPQAASLTDILEINLGATAKTHEHGLMWGNGIGLRLCAYSCGITFESVLLGSAG